MIDWKAIAFTIEVLPERQEVHLTGRATITASCNLPASLADDLPSVVEAQKNIVYLIRLQVYGQQRDAFWKLQKAILPLLMPEHKEAWTALLELRGFFGPAQPPAVEEYKAPARVSVPTSSAPPTHPGSR